LDCRFNNEGVMGAARKSKAIRAAEEAATLAELQARTAIAEAETSTTIRSTRIADAEALQRIRTAEVQTRLAWLIEIKRVFFGPALVALVTAIWHFFKK
jgi:hypothetical protein